MADLLSEAERNDALPKLGGDPDHTVVSFGSRQPYDPDEDGDDPF